MRRTLLLLVLSVLLCAVPTSCVGGPVLPDPAEVSLFKAEFDRLEVHLQEVIQHIERLRTAGKSKEQIIADVGYAAFVKAQEYFLRSGSGAGGGGGSTPGSKPAQ